MKCACGTDVTVVHEDQDDLVVQCPVCRRGAKLSKERIKRKAMESGHVFAEIIGKRSSV